MPALARPPSDVERIASLDALRWAWLRVRENHGAAGGDGITIARFEQMRDEQLLSLSDDLRSGAYQPGPVRTTLIRGPRKDRRIALLCLRDRVLQRAVLDLLGPRCERRFRPASFGYRTGLSLHDAVDRIVHLRNRGLTTVIDADIRSCFERLDHAVLGDAIAAMLPGLDPGIQALLDAWIAMTPPRRARSGQPAPLARGILQGAPISPLLCNIYLHRLDEAMARKRLSLVRYADDFILLFADREAALVGLEALQAALDAIRLEINPDKSWITSFAIGFDFLGVSFKDDEYRYCVEGKEIVIDDFPPGWFHYLAEGYGE